MELLIILLISGFLFHVTDAQVCNVGHGCAQNCVQNTPGVDTCSCNDGFQLNADGKACDGCAQGKYGTECSSTCTCVTDNTDSCNTVDGTCTCKSGFTDANCQTNINECDTGTHECDSNSVCSDTEGSYNCTCNAGFSSFNATSCTGCIQGKYGTECSSTCTCVTDNTDSCDTVDGTCTCKSGFTDANCQTNINECDTGAHECDSNSVCSDTEGSYDCTCNAGFSSYNATSCEGCIQGKYGTECSSTCTCVTENTETCNTVDGQCTCKSGFTDSNCQTNINECDTGAHECDSNSVCSDTEGSYNCTCNAGFSTFNATSCTGCIQGKYGSECSSTCTCVTENTETCSTVDGKCTCKSGFTDSNCQTNINECDTGTHECDSNSVCSDTGGSYNCTCNAGFSAFNATSCTGCTDDTFGIECASNCTCVKANTVSCNTVNGSCVCNTGFEGDNCELNIDECARNIDQCDGNSVCNDTVGHYNCDCLAGFQTVDATTCEGCKDDTFGVECANNCTCVKANTDSCNTANGSCVCNTGFEGVNCELNIDECARNIDQCDSNSVCNDTVGHYNCDCFTGFKAVDATTCEGCTDWTFGDGCTSNCSCVISNTDNCNPVNGTCTCDKGFRGVDCELNIDECSEGTHKCGNFSTCNDTYGWYTCDCHIGYTPVNETHCTECTGWTFGNNCTSDCTCDLNNTISCDNENGFCTCSTGWQNANCSEDTNECAIPGSCHPDADCTNLEGNYTCTCKEFFEGDGKSCKDTREESKIAIIIAAAIAGAAVLAVGIASSVFAYKKIIKKPSAVSTTEDVPPEIKEKEKYVKKLTYGTATLFDFQLNHPQSRPGTPSDVDLFFDPSFLPDINNGIAPIVTTLKVKAKK